MNPRQVTLPLVSRPEFSARASAAKRDALLERRLEVIVPDLMAREGFEAWVLIAREYNEDPVLETMLPATWLGTARRRTILVFTEGGRRRAAISRYPIGPFPSIWDPAAQPDQWAALTDHLSAIEGRIGINVSSVFALADGLTLSEYDGLVSALPDETAAHLTGAENLAIGWLETRLPEEVADYSSACAHAHEFLRRALSSEVVTPGKTTTDDIAWWLSDAVSNAGFGSWFHPGVTLQRRGDDTLGTPADGHQDRTVTRGDLLHIDFGIVTNGYHTDQQQHAYVLGDGETAAPESLQRGLVQGNRLQDILMSEMRVGRTGNDVLSSALAQAQTEDIRPIIYTHPLGLHGHAAGATIGLWDNQQSVEGAGDYAVSLNTGWSIELAVEIAVSEWDGQTVKIMLEEDAFLSEEGIGLLDGRQTELWLI